MNKDALKAGIEVLSPKDGMLPFFMPNSGAEKYELKNGPGIVDLIPHKSFSTRSILKEIKTYGFMCPFEPCESVLKESTLKTFMVVCDTTGQQPPQHGEMFLLLYTDKAIQDFWTAVKSVEQELEFKARKKRDAKDEAKAAQLAREKALYEKENTPLIPNEYVSSTMEETEQEVKNLSMLTTSTRRPLLSWKVPLNISKRNKNDNDYGDDNDDDTFADIDHEESQTFQFISPTNNTPNVIVLDKLTQDMAVQAIPTSQHMEAQTIQHSKVHISTQYESLTLNETLQHSKLLPSMISFLKRVLPNVETALQENETVDLFQDILHVNDENNLDVDTHAMSQETKTPLKELRNFTNLEFSKGKSLTCIDWHPIHTDRLATAACKDISFDHFISMSCADEVGYIILWDFAEWIHPRLVLRSPVECSCFRFNPTNPDIIVGGCKNGQIIMWNISEEHDKKQMSFPTNNNNNNNNNNNIYDDKDKETSERKVIMPFASSNPDYNHRRYVADLTWLPPEIHINAKGRLLPKEYLTTDSYQFITISGDGYVMFWDTRYQEILEGKLPHIAKPKAPLQQQQQQSSSSSSSKRNSSIHERLYSWVPLFRIKAKRLEMAGEASLCQMNYSSIHSVSSKLISFQNSIICSSEEGDLLSITWLPRTNKESVDRDDKETKNDSNDEPEYTQWVAQDHKRPPVALARSSFFPHIVASVSDWNFHLWNIGTTSPKTPFFISPRSSAVLTGSQWSPTRPGVLFVSKSDGHIDVWDFTDTSYGPSATVLATPNSITSMEFLTRTNHDTEDTSDKGHSKQPQYVAMGDSIGSLHIFEVSRALSTLVPKELKIMNDFLESEWKRHQTNGESNNDDNEEETQDNSSSLSTLDTIVLETTSKEVTANKIKEESVILTLTAKEEKAYKEFESDCLKELNLIDESSPVQE